MTLEMEPTPDILKTLAQKKRKNQTVVGFAAETQDIEIHAQSKLDRKKLDWIIANQVGGKNNAFESDYNEVVMLGCNGERAQLGPDSKQVVAQKIIDLLMQFQ